MHWIYVCYLFLCVLQLPVHLILLALDLGMPCHLRRPPSEEEAASSACTLSDETHAMCVASTLFAVLYMTLTRDEDHAQLMSSTADTNDGFASAHGLIKSPMLVEAIRFVFWTFVACQGIVLASGTLDLVDLTYLELVALTLFRVAPIWALCRTANNDSRLWRGVAAVPCVLWYLHALIFSRPPHAPVLFALINAALCDALLVVGHTWDSSPPVLLVLHCRLFFVAATSTLTQAVPLFVLPG
jgi:hypothetical protein